MTIVLSLVILVAGLWSVLLYTSNHRYFESLQKDWQQYAGDQLVTVAIPARNEESNIGTCVRSLMKQTYKNIEILVLDDNSTDRTAEIVKDLMRTDSRIRLISGRKLEEGWRGKHFAMQQLYEQAKGSYILYSDADTRHTERSVAYGLGLLQSQDGAMISGYPKQVVRTLGIEILVAAMLFNPALFVPFKLQSKLQRPLWSMAIGQYVMIKKSTLDALGGFTRIKGKICDDVALARLCAKTGHRQLFAPMTYAVECEMFTSFKEGWKSLERSINGVVKQGWIGFLLILMIVVILLVLCFSPLFAVVLLVLTLAGQQLLLPLTCSVLGAALLFGTWKRCAIYFGFSVKSGLMGPMTLLLVILMYLNGVWLRATGKGFVWKGRIIS